ncbi:MAG: TIR domain-containing protein [Rhodospirillales bacterium]|nr:TIR domain-containing protein [Rhodospirillales bacterium]MBR9816576.1 TIR domain-containing protein [Rhodospirillales bacterium]
MAISQDTLRQNAQASSTTVRRSFHGAVVAGTQTAFLCHSHYDRSLAIGFRNYAERLGWDVYIDWLDEDMPERPTVETATRIQEQIKTRSHFLYLATRNSSESKWCPWEIGYANGAKSRKNILIIPTTDSFQTHGNEYLGLYQRIEEVPGGGLGRFEPGTTKGFYLR